MTILYGLVNIIDVMSILPKVSTPFGTRGKRSGMADVYIHAFGMTGKKSFVIGY